MASLGVGMAKNPVLALSSLELACKKGDPEGCVACGEMYQQGQGTSVDETRAMTLFRQACDANVAAGCRALAAMQHDGKGGLSVDKKKALQYLKRSCELDDLTACTFLKQVEAEPESSP
jgi:TPR repeat protein